MEIWIVFCVFIVVLFFIGAAADYILSTEYQQPPVIDFIPLSLVPVDTSIKVNQYRIMSYDDAYSVTTIMVPYNGDSYERFGSI